MFHSSLSTNLPTALILATFVVGCQQDRQNRRTVESPAGATDVPAAADAPASDRAARPSPEVQAVLDQLQALGGKPIDSLSAAEARQQPTPADAVKALLKKQGKSTAPMPVEKVEDREIKLADRTLPARIYWPAGDGPLPVVLFFHGGGWVIADKDVYDASPRALANQAHCIVVSVDYRQGPEHRFPAAHEDAFEAYGWVLRNASSLGGDPARIAVAGESAGGNLAASVSMMARDRKLALPLHQLLVYPIAGVDLDRPSYRENAAAKPLNKPMMKWFFDHYLRSPADNRDPRINLVDANLKGLPPTTIINAEIDPLRSEGELLADRLKSAGVAVEQKTYAGVVHEFFGMGAAVGTARDAVKRATAALDKAFGRPGEG